LPGHEAIRHSFYSTYGLHWSKDQNILVTSSRLTKNTTFWSVSAVGQPSASIVLPTTTHPTRSLILSPDGRFLIEKPWDDLIKVDVPTPAIAWRLTDGLPSGEPIVISASEDAIKAIAVDHDSTCIAVSVTDGVRLQALNGSEPTVVSSLGQVEAL